nr:MAG TPA: hypothetical protein [Caudoviricetes sp.]
MYLVNRIDVNRYRESNNTCSNFELVSTCRNKVNG